MAKYLKNTSGASGTWEGQTIASGSYYQLQFHEENQFAHSSLVITDIGNGNLVAARDDSGNTDISSVSEAIDFLRNETPTDPDGVIVTRPKAAKKGWTYHLGGIEFETSVLSSIVHNDADGNALNETTIKFYDDQDVELTVQGDLDTDCVKTVVEFEPTYDYEIIGGAIKTVSTITDKYRVWVIAVPDLTPAQGGTKVMVENINLRFVDPNNGVEVDGRASKFMTYNATYHTNKLQVIIKHPAGGKKEILLALELFRA